MNSQKIGYAKYRKNMPFCSNCKHKIVDMDKHIQSEEHKRNLRKDGRR